MAVDSDAVDICLSRRFARVRVPPRRAETVGRPWLRVSQREPGGGRAGGGAAAQTTGKSESEPYSESGCANRIPNLDALGDLPIIMHSRRPGPGYCRTVLLGYGMISMLKGVSVTVGLGA
jgi:hypothetical protein